MNTSFHFTFDSLVTIMFIIYSSHSWIILAIKSSFLTTLNSFENMVGSTYINTKYVLLVIILILTHLLGHAKLPVYLYSIHIHLKFCRNIMEPDALFLLQKT